MNNSVITEKKWNAAEIQAEFYGSIQEVEKEANRAEKDKLKALDPIHVRIAARDYFVRKQSIFNNEQS